MLVRLQCDCVVMTWHEKEPYIGKAQSFMHHVPPWAVGTCAEQEQQAIDVVDAAWFDVGGCNAGVMNLPIVKAESRSEENGNYWRCEQLAARPSCSSAISWFRLSTKRAPQMAAGVSAGRLCIQTRHRACMRVFYLVCNKHVL